MTPTPDTHEKLERLIHRTLRELPARRAPRSLEQRVQAELERRAARPWWHRGFAHWPLPARAAFVVLSAGMVKLVLLLATWVAVGFDSTVWRETFAQPIGWMESGLTVIHAIVGFFELMLRNIPPLWLYGGLAFCAVMYGAIFSLGAVAYRTYHAPR